MHMKGTLITKILFVVFFCLLTLTILAMYYRFFILHEYETFYDNYLEEEGVISTEIDI